MAEYIEVGYSKKTHGIRGELKVVVEDHFLDDFLNAKAVFLDLPGGKVPYFLDTIRDAGSLLASFEDIDSKEKALPLSGKAIFLRKEDVSASKPQFQEGTSEFLQGYKVFDAIAGEIGRIDRVEEYPQQEMAIVELEKKTLLIPLHPDLIVRIDEVKKELHCQLPEGLLEL
ncbi:MAG: 16S rRNA processing protein RimM [Saprospiraceae bacterium]|nr:16S rRNA processing protein RimM [Saprospiraceae bacterium]